MSARSQAAPDDAAALPRPQGKRIASGFRIVSILTLASRVLGMIRDMAMAYAFGAGPLMDAFSVAFRIPNLARRLFGEGALTTAFLPVFIRELEASGPAAARRVSTAVTISLTATLLALVLAGELLLACLGMLMPTGSDARMLIVLSAQMLPYLLLICLTAQLSAVLQSVERFLWPSVVPTILNVIWIGAVFTVIKVVERPELQIQFIALSIVGAGLVQCTLSVWATRAAGFHFSAQWREGLPCVREIAVTMLPVLLGLSITQINDLADSLLAWGLAAPAAGDGSKEMLRGIRWPLETGSASALFYAQRMYQFPIGVFGIALGTVLFPLLSRHAERGELVQVGRDQTLGLRLTVAIGVPASVGLMLLAERIAVLFFQRGAFTAQDASLTAGCIAAYGAGVWAFLGLIIINRGFYALGDRTTPVRYGLYAVALNLVLNLLLIWPFAASGLAWASSLAAMAQVLLTVAAYQRRFKLLELSEVRIAAAKTFRATTLMGLACWGTMQLLPIADSTLARVLALVGPLIAAMTAYLLIARLIGLREPFILLSRRLEE